MRGGYLPSEHAPWYDQPMRSLQKFLIAVREVSLGTLRTESVKKCCEHPVKQAWQTMRHMCQQSRCTMLYTCETRETCVPKALIDISHCIGIQCPNSNVAKLYRRDLITETSQTQEAASHH